MSLINQMLQDLDARAGRPGAAPLPSDVKPVAPPERGLPFKRVLIAGGATLALGAAGFAGWHFLAPKPDAAVAAPAPAALQPTAVADQAPVVAFEVPVPPRGDAAVPAVAAAADDTPAATTQAPASPAPVAAPAAAPKTAVKTAAKTVRPVPGKPATPVVGGRVETPAQRAENSYRRALAALEEGRVTEAIAGLQAALAAAPRNDAARQTLVGLLIEAGRSEEAMRQLQAGLAIEPRQPALAMLLARLEIERGGSGIETLMRTLPHAAGQGDYHAFLAGALARAGRHREAAEHYGVALRSAPQNGVWWMGLGIALQAEQRKPEAAGALRKALDSGTLPAELQGFVERKLRQLGP